MTDLLPAPAARRVFACFAAAYFLSYALRAINAVIAPELVSEFGLTAAQLGSLTGAYLIAFAAMQLPLGWALDRFGPRRTEAALLLVGAAGSALFAAARDPAALWVGRALIGMGVSACLMGAFKGFRFWFAPQRQGQLGAWMLVAGTCGVLLTTVPVQAALPWIGWRGVFVLTAVALALASLALFLGLPRRDREPAPDAVPAMPPGGASPDAAGPAAAAPAATPAASAGGYGAVLIDPFFWRMSLVGVFFQGGFIAVQTLWLGPWFTEVLGGTPRQASYWLLGFNVALLAAYVVLGVLAPVLQRRGWAPPTIATASNAVGLAITTTIVLAGAAGQAWWWFGIAAATTCNMLLQTHVGMSYPAHIAGRVGTAYNFLVFVGAFVLQWGAGALVDLSRAAGHAPAEALQHAFGVLCALQAAALATFALWRPAPRAAQPEAGAPA